MKLYSLTSNKLTRRKYLPGKTLIKKFTPPQITFLLIIIIMFCGLFVFWGKNNNSYSLVIVPQALAKKTQTNYSPELKRISNASLMQEIICQKQKETFSPVNPALNDYRLKTLCQDKLNLSKQPEIAVKEKEAWQKQVEEILLNTPMVNMKEAIIQQKKVVAAFLVGIALKESHFGRHTPRKNGKSCFNYWGYKGGQNPTKGGYSCFSSPTEAVKIVGKRLEKLAIKQKRNTPQKMIIWKCGSSCASHSPQGVSKWISDVSINFNRINQS